MSIVEVTFSSRSLLPNSQCETIAVFHNCASQHAAIVICRRFIYHHWLEKRAHFNIKLQFRIGLARFPLSAPKASAPSQAVLDGLLNAAASRRLALLLLLLPQSNQNIYQFYTPIKQAARSL